MYEGVDDVGIGKRVLRWGLGTEIRPGPEGRVIGLEEWLEERGLEEAGDTKLKNSQTWVDVVLSAQGEIAEGEWIVEGRAEIPMGILRGGGRK